MKTLSTNDTINNTGFGTVKVIQGDGFRYGIDAVLLSAFACGETGANAIIKNARVADLGAGCGVVAMITAYKRQDILVDGFEVREEEADRAYRGAKLSGLQERCSFFCTDVNDICDQETFENNYDAVVTNPPYFKKSGAILNKAEAKRIARHETSVNLAEWSRVAALMLKNSGDLYMVHRPDRLVDILASMRQSGIEPKEIQFISPRRGKASNIVLIHGVKGAKSELKMLKELIVHDEGQAYTEEINRIYGR